jgi:hypothetical protein
LRPKLVTVDHSTKPPFKCLVTSRRDGELVDFGKDFVGIDPHVYVLRDKVEEAAEVCGMVRQPVVDELRAELEEANAEAGRLRAIVAGKEALSEAKAKLRESLDAHDAAEQ